MWPFAHLARLMTDTIFTVKSLSTDVERDLINKEVGDPKHSTYHVEHGPMTVDNTADYAHSIHHHLVDADHDKLHDLDLRAQKVSTFFSSPSRNPS